MSTEFTLDCGEVRILCRVYRDPAEKGIIEEVTAWSVPQFSLMIYLVERSIYQYSNTLPGTGISYEFSHLIYLLVGGIHARVDIT